MHDKLTNLLYKLLHLLSPALAERYTSSLAQFVKFMIVGASNTLISYLINVAVLLALRNAHVEWDYIAGNTIGFLLSVLWSFYWNNRFVFTDGNQNRVWWKTLLKTYLSYAFTGIILNNVLSWLWINQLGISKFIAPIINLIICVPLNFILNKRWAFRK